MNRVRLFIFCVGSLLTIFLFCESKKEIINKEVDKALVDSNFLKLGYVIGTIIYNENSLCDYTIMVQETGFHLDPVNFNNDGFKAFRAQGKKVIFKYRSLRRANRCDNIQPIELSDIKIIE